MKRGQREGGGGGSHGTAGVRRRFWKSYERLRVWKGKEGEQRGGGVNDDGRESGEEGGGVGKPQWHSFLISLLLLYAFVESFHLNLFIYLSLFA